MTRKKKTSTAEAEHPDTPLLRYLVQDLTERARAGELPAAYDCEAVYEPLARLLDLSRRARRPGIEKVVHPALVGEAGVGKTAVVCEWVRRLVQEEPATPLRVVELSLRRALTLGEKRQHQALEELEELAIWLAEHPEVIPFFGDFDLAYSLDLAHWFVSLGHQLEQPMILEGSRAAVGGMFEEQPDLGRVCVLLFLDEPDQERTSRILEHWCEDLAQKGVRIGAQARELALHLSYRFGVSRAQPRAVLDFLGALVRAEDREEVGVAQVVERFCAAQRIPAELVDPTVPLDLARLERHFGERVFGQNEAVQAIVRMVAQVKAGLSDQRRPFGVFLFAGPTGVGKTEIAKVLAEYLYGDPRHVVRFNLADFQDPASANVLFGDPTEWGWGKRGTLTQRLLGQSSGVLLLDEFEKAHTKVHDQMLPLMDEGQFQNGAGETVDCRSMVIVATSNAGAEAYREQRLGFASVADEERREDAARRALQNSFRPELLNRFDQVVLFRPLKRLDIRQIALREIELLRSRSGLRQRGITLDVDEAVIDWLVAHGYQPDWGARFLRRTLERHVAATLAEAVARTVVPANTRITLTVRGNDVVARVETPARRRRPKVEPAPTEAATASAQDLRALAEDLLRRAAPRLEELDQRREAWRELLEKINAPGFWDREADRESVLARFRELDVAMHVEERLAAPLRQLAATREQDLDRRRDVEEMRRCLAQAEEAFADWTERRSDDRASAVWLCISSLDPTRSPGSWILELAEMERRWCEKLHLDTTVAAVELRDAQVGRVFLLVEGPGAQVHLRMEDGVHRRALRGEPDHRARIDVIVRSPAPVPAGTAKRDEAPSPYRGRKPPAKLGVRAKLLLRFLLERRGLPITLVGEDEELLVHLAHDLREAWDRVEAEPDAVARLYNVDGTGARDPRTDTVVSDLRKVLRGELDRFLERWRARDRRT